METNNLKIFHEDPHWVKSLHPNWEKAMLNLQRFTLNGKSILITGGTGSLGKKLVEIILSKFPNVKKMVIYSRDEYKQYEMKKRYPQREGSPMRYIIGDVRDRDKLIRSCEGMDYIIHAGALKHVPTGEYNPDEVVKTNIMGAMNVVDASLENNVETVVALSTDKAVAPVNLYGATKLVSDKLFISANDIKGYKKTKFCVARYGNVFMSRGSVIPYFLEKKVEGVLPITDKEMTRFNIHLEEAVNLILYILEKAKGREIFIPKVPSYDVLTLKNAISPECKTEIIGIRQGEKVHEELVTANDSLTTLELKDKYIILPKLDKLEFKEFQSYYNAELVKKEFSYNSKDNTKKLTSEEITKKINEEIYSA